LASTGVDFFAEDFISLLFILVDSVDDVDLTLFFYNKSKGTEMFPVEGFLM
jgi:hypothetical protein